MAALNRTVKLNNGKEMPIIGLGTSQGPKDEVQTAVRVALDAGYRHIDTAYNYKNEEAIGEVLQEYIKSGKVKREELFIVTKYEGDDTKTYPTNEAGTWKAADKWDLLETWKAMEELVDLGLTKSIGVSNFSISQVEKICKVAKHKPVTNQKDLFEACKEYGMIITAYSPIGSPGRPVLMKQKDEPVALEDPVILRIARKYGKTPAQVLLRNLMQRGIIVIPKSVTPERIRSNFQVFDFSLSEEDIEEIEKIKTRHRYYEVMGAMFKDHPECPW